ncbi:hypothetical protein P8625_12510 [Tenacibaculum tangerinum]|uniref:Uncharacterized protein n=1 Tax=Tenacibaculum tangerinum TaxID=3038772 RepID=A0ABY8L0L1_9FLAO|nr:hypothetical protein [Tenacibaculum tangerinum]WGH74890.1 hypothetical protein P8625_12510 [Tenacibaculum tangerinum]
MHKKLASDLTSLAHSILRMKNKEDVFALKEKAYEVYEKLSVLAYVEEYMNTTPNPTKTKEALLNEMLLAEEKREKELLKETTSTINKATNHANKEEVEEGVFDKKVSEEVFIEEEIEDNLVEEEIIIHRLDEDLQEESDESAKEHEVKKVEEIIEQPFDELEDLLRGTTKDVKDDVKDVGERKTPTLEDELQDTISVDVMADLFTKADTKKTLNDHFQKIIQIDLNDRIAFVKHLFNGDQNDFNRVVSQLNTFKTEKEAKKFIQKMIKPDYDWSAKEEYENRLLEIIERRFA